MQHFRLHFFRVNWGAASRLPSLYCPNLGRNDHWEEAPPRPIPKNWALKFFYLFFQKIIEKSSGVVDESLKYVEAGVNLVSEDVQELSQAIVEDTQARFTNLPFLLDLDRF